MQVCSSVPHQQVFQLQMAQYGMLADLAQQAAEPTVSFLETLCSSCLAQEQADAGFQIHWSWHLLACLHAVTGAELLVGARAVTFNPTSSIFTLHQPVV